MKEKIAKLLSQAEKKTFDNREVFFVGRDVFMELWKLREAEIKRMVEEGHDESYALKTALSGFFKLLNPKPQPMKFKSFGYHPKYSLVRDREKIFNKYDLEKDFYRWANRERKMIKEYIKENIFDEVEAQKLLDMVERKIKKAELTLKEIKKNPDRFNIIRTDIIHRGDKVYKPVLYARFKENSRSYPLYLKELVPNVFWELKEPVIKKKKEIKFLKELEEYENPFHYYYIKEKK